MGSQTAVHNANGFGNDCPQDAKGRLDRIAPVVACAAAGGVVGLATPVVGGTAAAVVGAAGGAYVASRSETVSSTATSVIDKAATLLAPAALEIDRKYNVKDRTKRAYAKTMTGVAKLDERYKITSKAADLPGADVAKAAFARAL